MSFLPPLIIGEVLFDHFPAGKRVLGGAPFNVAWNLQGFGLSPLFLSAVGEDDEGREIRDRMRAWGLDDRGLQVADKPTGKVHIDVEDGRPSFEILDDQAYDAIRPPQFEISEQQFSLLYLGSLAFRHEPSRSTIKQLITDSGLQRFVDINVRQPWFDRDWLPDLLDGARFVKLNNDELAQLAEMQCDSADAILEASERLRLRFGGVAQSHYITCGGSGAHVVDDQGRMYAAAAPEPDPLVDTVGAGDAFAAATIVGIVKNRGVEETLKSAVSFASRTCQLRGATTEDRNHYRLLTAS